MMIIFGVFVGGIILSLLYYRGMWSTRINRPEKKKKKTLYHANGVPLAEGEQQPVTLRRILAAQV